MRQRGVADEKPDATNRLLQLVLFSKTPLSSAAAHGERTLYLQHCDSRRAQPISYDRAPLPIRTEDSHLSRRHSLADAEGGSTSVPDGAHDAVPGAWLR
jgi:hypothetical protein